MYKHNTIKNDTLFNTIQSTYVNKTSNMSIEIRFQVHFLKVVSFWSSRRGSRNSGTSEYVILLAEDIGWRSILLSSLARILDCVLNIF